MKILFLCTAHNSLSQQLFLALCQTHSITIEYALSDKVMIEAAALAQPDLIICPFLTSRVPPEIYTDYLTLIVHPGPPGDAGPSAIDWVLMGDDGAVPESSQLLQTRTWSRAGRSHWGVTVLQAVAELDAGPIWAFEQFEIDIDSPGVTKSTLYRGPITRAAITATLAALVRIATAAHRHTCHPTTYAFSRLVPDPEYRLSSVAKRLPFLGGATHRRPLLKAAHRDFDVRSDTARDISRRVRSADSQPGCLSQLFGGPSLYIYGGTIEERPDLLKGFEGEPGSIMACRDGAVCIATCDGMGIWITHVRRVKRKVDAMLWPKVPAAYGLCELGLIDDGALRRTLSPRPTVDWSKAAYSTHQEIWVDFTSYPNARRVAYVYFDFYNGAMSTEQCSRLIEALEFVASTHVVERRLSAVVLMGGESYFSNGIALNVIESSPDPAAESWRNINRIDDVVHMLLEDFPQRNITTVAALRGNCAAGGVALATACDTVIVGSETVLNPAYRALGLHGSEYHSLSYGGRCGDEGARRLLRDMVPVSPFRARDMGLVDHVLPGSGQLLDTRIRNHVRAMIPRADFQYVPGKWKAGVDVSPSGLAAVRAQELSEMAKDLWSARSERYYSRRRDFVRKIKPVQTPLRFASHRRRGGEEDDEESDAFDDAANFEKRAMERIVQSRLLEMERQKTFTPTSPASSRGPLDCSDQDLIMLSNMEVGTRRSLGPAFSCYYSYDKAN
ncbi:hydrogenase maturation factor hoxX [Dactylonectria estremocensis]|uniref:Hydrogenase maturation factor hoxX n=1 Tax=Dactylonectria estremocensis TaxID=1079267 RepID=A0A9P9J682_9HYPO|nr:hydrogenase maturation factor hoxX [Dactylonectria estremocensis]